MLGSLTLVDKYVMDVWISGLDLLVRNRPVSTVVRKSCIFCSFRFCSLLLVLNRKSYAGLAALDDKSSGYFYHLFYAVIHVNINFCWSSIVQGHQKIFMDFSSGDFHFPNLTLVICLEVLYHHINFLYNFVGYLHLIYMPNYSHRMPVDNLLAIHIS